MDLFSGENRISRDIMFIPVLLDVFKLYPGCNQNIFEINSDKKPTLILVKKLLTVLISFNILIHSAIFTEILSSIGSKKSSRTSSNVNCKAVAIFDD